MRKAYFLGAAVAVIAFCASTNASTNVSGTITTDTTWDVNGSPYIIQVSTVTVQNGATLRIEPGVQVSYDCGGYGGNSGYLAVGSSAESTGVLIANGVTFNHYGSGDFGVIYTPYSSGSLTNCTFNGVASAMWHSFGVGIQTSNLQIDGCTFQSPGISIGNSAEPTFTNCIIDTLYIDSGWPTVTNCTLTSGVRCVPDFIPELANNSFSPSAVVRLIAAPITRDVTLGVTGGAKNYIILTNTVTVQNGATLRIEPGVQVSYDCGGYGGNSGYLAVGSSAESTGVLIANGVTFNHYGSGDFGVIYTPYSSGSLTNCTFNGVASAMWHSFGVGIQTSNLQIDGCTFQSPTLYLNLSDPLLQISCNSFADVFVSGDNQLHIDARNNWWGTTDPVQIQAKITDHYDNSSLPYVDFEPFLYTKCENPPSLPEGDLSGYVKDQITGQPISSAEITVVGQETTYTDSNGSYVFDGLTAGQADIIISKTGYYPITKNIIVDLNSCQVINFNLTPESDGNLPALTVSGKFCGPDKHSYYLDDITLNETFTATIDWKGYTPYQVKWILPHQTITDEVSGDTVSRSFDTGSDFAGGGKLKVIAIADGGAIQSSEYEVNLEVIPMPPIVNLVPAVFYQAVTVGNDFEYQVLGLQSVNFSLGGWPAGKMPLDFPLFGGKKMEIGGEFDLSGTVDSDGTVDLFTIGVDVSSKKVIRKHVPTKNHKGIKLPFIELAPYGSFYASMAYSKTFGEWKPTGGFEIGCTGTGTSPQVPFPPPASFLYWRAEVSLDLALGLGISDWDANGPLYDGSFTFEPTAKGIVGAGVADTACIEGYVGGGFHAELQFLPEIEWQDTYVIMLLGANVEFGPFYTLNVEVRRVWPEQQLGTMVFNMNALLRSTQWQLTSRDYLKYNQSMKLMNNMMGEATSSQTIEQPIATVVFPYPTPDVARIGANVLGVWIADNTNRSLINRTELRFAKYVNGNWSSILPVADDGTADLAPRLCELPGGKAVCVWQNSDAVLSDLDDIETFKSHLEISAAVYDGNSNSWSALQRLTTNSHFDRSPKVSGLASNNIMAVWISNLSNDTWGSAAKPNNILWSIYNGATWSSPTILTFGFGAILDTTLAYNGIIATYVFCTDANDNFDDSNDQELWACTFSGGSWSSPVRLTYDTNTDSSPRLVYDSYGTLYMAWVKDNDIRFATGTNVGSSVVVVSPGASMGAKDFDLIIGDNDQIALVWNDVSETYNDLWVSYYEPITGTWSKPRQLTHDDAGERFVAGVFDANENLLCVYGKTYTAYEDKTVDVNGQQVIVKGVPKAGQSDLVYLSYSLKADLAVSVEDVNILPINPEPNSVATISATIHNIGEAAANDVNVAFYAGNPQSGGTRIGTIQTIPGPLAGGNDANVSVTWQVPETNSPINIYVIVDPCLVQDDKNTTNNTAIVKVLASDLVVSEIIAQKAGRNYIVTVRVANEGVLSAENFEMELRRDDPNGPKLGGAHIFEILPGAYHDVTFTLSFLIVGDVNVYASIDTSNLVDELGEENNYRSVRLSNYAFGNLDDLYILASEWLLTGANLKADIYPFGGDQIVDFKDFAEFAQYWGVGLQP